MEHSEFLARVRRHTGVESDDQALNVAGAVLETLGECVYRTECEQLAAELPAGIKGLLFARQPPEQGREDVRQISAEEFCNRVSARSGAGYPDAVKYTKGVFSVLQRAVSSGQLSDVISELPAGLQELFEKCD